MTVKVAVFMGTRPEAIKLAPVVDELKRSDVFEPLVINSGQHRELIQQVIETFQIEVAAELEVMVSNQSLARLTSRLIDRIDSTLADLSPDLVLVQGDTTTVFSAALASFYRRIPVGHIEAGLRTGSIESPFPEEANRRLTSLLVRWHYAPTAHAQKALLAERIDPSSILVTGNTVIDALIMELNRQQVPEVQCEIDEKLNRICGAEWRRNEFILVTGHRRENFGEGFEQICLALRQLAEKFPQLAIVYPVHLNPNVRETVLKRLSGIPTIRLIEPQPYREFVALASECRLIITDSGGLQEEASALGKPVLVMRDSTERPEGVEAGFAKLVGARADRIVSEAAYLLTDPVAYRKMADRSISLRNDYHEMEVSLIETRENPYGDGHASRRIVEHLTRVFS